MENTYFETFDIRNQADFILDTTTFLRKGDINEKDIIFDASWSDTCLM